MDLWTKLENGDDDDDELDLDYSAWVLDCPPVGPCAILTSTEDVHVNSWRTQAAWQKRVVTVGSVNNKTLLPGHTLRIRVGFDHSGVFLPLGGGYSSSLNYTS